MTDTKRQQCIKLSWKLIEHKLMYYNPMLIDLEYWPKLAIPDDIYDMLAKMYLNLCIELNVKNTVICRKGADLSRPCVHLILRKYGKNEHAHLVKEYLIHSYLYYCLHENIISDPEYDGMARTLLTNYDTINHDYLFLISKTDLECGTLFDLPEKAYPKEYIEEAKQRLAEDVKGRTAENINANFKRR